MHRGVLLTVLNWGFEATKHLAKQIVKNGEEQTDKDESIHSGQPLTGLQSYETDYCLSR